MLAVDKQPPPPDDVMASIYTAITQTTLNVDKCSASVDIIAKTLSPLTFSLPSGLHGVFAGQI